MTTGNTDKEIAPRPDHPVTLLGVRELVPVTRLNSQTAVTVIDGVLTIVRVLKAA